MALTEWLRQRINNSYDQYVNAFTTIETAHHTIHNGKHYFVSGVYDLPINNVIDIQFTTPNLDIYTHLLFKFDNESELEWYLYEGVTIESLGFSIKVQRVKEFMEAKIIIIVNNNILPVNISRNPNPSCLRY